MKPGLQLAMQLGGIWGSASAYVWFFGLIHRGGVPFPAWAQILMLPAGVFWWTLSLAEKTLYTMFIAKEGILLGFMLWLPCFSGIAIGMLIYYGLKGGN